MYFLFTYKNPQIEQIAGKFPNWQQSWRSRPWKVRFFLLHFISSRIISFTNIGQYLHCTWHWNKIFVCFQNRSNLGPQQKSDSGIYSKHDLSFRSQPCFKVWMTIILLCPKKIPFFDRCGFRIAGHARRSTWPAASLDLLVGKQQQYHPHGCNHHHYKGPVSNAL